MSPRIPLALFVLLLACVLNTAALGWEALSVWPPRKYTDPLTLYEMRLERLRQDLPPRGVVGYRSSCPWARSEGVPDAGVFDMDYARTRYAVAPVLVDPDHIHSTNIILSPQSIGLLCAKKP